MTANVIEAAEQCGVLRIPKVNPPVPLSQIFGELDDRPLIFCDETAAVCDPITALQSLSLPVAVLIGPEGGFSEAERLALRAHTRSVTVSLGPRVMRADTAAVAVLALVNAVVGDWREP